MKVTTAFKTLIDDLDEVMTGEECYPVYGPMVTSSEYRYIISQFGVMGVNRFWDCIRKAFIAQTFLKKGHMTFGRFYIHSKDGNDQYGFEFNPPFEFHTWLSFGEYSDDIIDFAAPGVIEKALTTFDNQGALVVGREPIIVAGPPPDWLEYVAYETYI